MTTTELNHLDFGSILKLRILGMSVHAAAQEARYSRPTVNKIEAGFIKGLAQMPLDETTELFSNVKEVDDPIRVIARYRTP